MSHNHGRGACWFSVRVAIPLFSYDHDSVEDELDVSPPPELALNHALAKQWSRYFQGSN